METVGVLSTGVYIPEKKLTSADLAKQSGLPIEVIEEKMGIREKPVPGEDDHTCAMGIFAAKNALAKVNLNPKEIDVVVYIGEEHKEYPLWTAGIKLQHEVGAVNAWAFDTALRCGTTIMALKLAKDMMLADPDINTVLLAGGYRNVDFINYQNPRTRFMFNLGAGGGAMILQKNHTENQLLGTHMITDGSFSEDVVVTTGGTKNPITKETLDAGLYQLDVLDPPGMKKRLEQKSMDNFITCIEKALDKSGHTKDDIDYVAMLHMKRSAHTYVLDQLGVDYSKSIYLEDYGHIGQMDQIISLELAEDRDMLKDGDIIVLVSAGIGYAWGANVIQWGK
ncbi:3-oxoacyl-ACP synthase [Virgibacillus litoralis]|uniref:3-oxoacyl-[acyl-carrier-protein] synthase-3 n=1 Tax=Virgibacillus litoralis TaxID=578221 RepID=A0ABS4HBH6_9BACI|nr:3-oxoacyl-ACP synthase [Virgibacillus litoralis]MBP1948246.1 3-oxoacyl-[acyl-carrier-protein] synthase-3 [Virgibacillus litoralis]